LPAGRAPHPCPSRPARLRGARRPRRTRQGPGCRRRAAGVQPPHVAQGGDRPVGGDPPDAVGTGAQVHHARLAGGSASGPPEGGEAPRPPGRADALVRRGGAGGPPPGLLLATEQLARPCEVVVDDAGERDPTAVDHRSTGVRLEQEDGPPGQLLGAGRHGGLDQQHHRQRPVEVAGDAPEVGTAPSASHTSSTSSTNPVGVGSNRLRGTHPGPG
jgi:hypothetical protein